MAATDQVAAPSEFDPPDGHGSRRVRVAGASYARPMMGPIALIVIVAFFGALYPDTFLTRTNLVTNVLEVVAVLIIVASGQTVVMVVGEFDLSVGGVAALATAVTASFIATSTLDGQAQTPGSVFWSVVLGFAIGIGCGVLNGLLVAYLGVLAFIATLGMAQVYTSLANHRVDGQPVFGLVEHNFVDIARGDLLGVSNKIWISLAFAGAVWLLLDRTTLGRKMYAVGGNAHAAYLSGLNAKRIRLAAFATAGSPHRSAASCRRRPRRRRTRRHRSRGCSSRSPACSWAWQCSGRGDQTCRARCSAWSCCARSTTASTSLTSTTTFRTPSPGRRSCLRYCPRRWHGCERFDDRVSTTSVHHREERQ